MKKLWQDFKAFISRGNVLDLAVGVIIGGAFNAIVTALVNILLSLCTWGVPGGLKGLVTVLPAVNDAQRGMNDAIGLGQSFQASQLQELGTNLAKANYATQLAADPDYLLNNPNLIEAAKTTIQSKYTLHGTTYTYNLSAVIDWGAFINACISFLIIAITLFIVVKVATSMAARRAKMKEELKNKIKKGEAPEEAVVEEAVAPAEVEEAVQEAKNDEMVDLLKEIRDSLKAKPIADEVKENK